MGLRTLSLSSPQNGLFHKSAVPQPMLGRNYRPSYRLRVVSQKTEDDEQEQPKKKQSFFTSVTDALDFAQARSVEDAQLIDDAREATQTGGQMNREQVLLIITILWSQFSCFSEFNQIFSPMYCITLTVLS